VALVSHIPYKWLTTGFSSSYLEKKKKKNYPLSPACLSIPPTEAVLNTGMKESDSIFSRVCELKICIWVAASFGDRRHPSPIHFGDRHAKTTFRGIP
jgi:hypothetical protein